jgi:acetyl esterase/lipase
MKHCLFIVLLAVAATNAPRRSSLVYPRTPPKGVIVLRDVEYAKAGDKRLLLDLYLPERARGKPMPVIIWVHGGAWAGGSKNGGCPALGMVTNGYAVAAVDYRLTRDKVSWPVFLEDCQTAVRWLRDHAQEYNLDPQRFGAWGSSAGGQLTAMLGLKGDVRAVCDWFGATQYAAKMRGPYSANPVDHVSSNAPPFLIQHGDADVTIPVSDSRELHEALRKAGVESTLEIVPGVGHDFKGADDETVRRLIRQAETFFDNHLKP